MQDNHRMHNGNRARLMRAAGKAFLAKGYKANLDDIARRAGVVKQTLYHHFSSKDRLFQEVARELAKGILVSLDAEPKDLQAELVRFGLVLRRRVLGPEALALFRTLSAEVPRFPALARSLYAGSAGETSRRLAAFLARAMERGMLRRDDPEFAADMLLGMLTGQERIRRLFGAKPPGGPRSETGHATKIVECFLRAFAPGHISKQGPKP